MKQFLLKLTILLIFVFSSISLFAQAHDNVIKELNEVFQESLYKTEISIRNDGVVNRTDNNGNTFVYNINDVKEVISDNDGFQNMLIVLKEGKKSKGIVEGRNVESGLNVVAFTNRKDCMKAIELFKTLIE